MDVSHDHLSAPDCEDAVGREGESGEASFYCGAAEDDGRRIKLFVSIDDESGDALVLAWRCAAPSLSWKQVRQNPRRRCGTVVGARGAG